MSRAREHGVFSAKPGLLSLLKDTRGQGLVEYLLILVLVACGAVVAQQLLACQIGCAMEITAKHIENFMSGGKKIPPGQLKKCSKMCT